MIQLKTKEERAEIRKKKQQERDEKINSRFLELNKQYSNYDSVCIVASEFGISIPTVYEVKKRICNNHSEGK